MLGMKTMMDTIHQIDENSKKMAYKPFVQDNVNILKKEIGSISSGLKQIALSCQEQGKNLRTNTLEKQYESEEMQSDSSGNYSE